MSYHKSFYGAYGALVSCVDDSEKAYAILKDHEASYLSAGAYDRWKDWLYIKASGQERCGERTIELETGDYHIVPPYSATDETIKHWDWLLVDAAQRLGISIEDGPGWFFVPNMS